MKAQIFLKMFLAPVILALMLALSVATIQASPSPQKDPDYAEIDAYITEQMDALGVPGLALGIVQDGEIAHARGFGVADSSGRKVTPQTPFYIGSLTKSFTAMAVMQLVEAGKIDLDAPVRTYLPWFRLADEQAAAKMTVRHLLNHTTGISEKDGNYKRGSQQTMEEVVRGLERTQPTQSLGETYQYSNINYVIAGLIVEQVSGQSYAEYVTEHIFEPLDMRHSFTSRKIARSNGMTAGHIFIFGQPIEMDLAVNPGRLPEGYLISSAEDMSHYIIAQLNDGRYQDTTVLSQHGMAEMHAPAVSMKEFVHYGMGWMLFSKDGEKIIGHGGDTANFHSNIFLMPDHNLGLILLFNASGYEQSVLVEQVAFGVYNMLNGETPAPLSPEHVSKRFLYWSIGITPFLQIVGGVFVWRRKQLIKGWGVILTVVLNLTVVMTLLGFSQLIPIPISSLLVHYPEVGLGLITITVLGVGWSVIFGVLHLVSRRLYTLPSAT